MSSSRRLFFALSLPDALQQQVIRWRAEAFKPEDGRPVAAANLHLTLAFLGEVSAQKEQALKTQAGRITQAGFSLNLDDLATGRAPEWYGWAANAPHARCYSWRNCCVRKRLAAAVIKARCRFIPISRYYAPRPSRSLSLQARRVGRSTPAISHSTNRRLNKAAPAITN